MQNLKPKMNSVSIMQNLKPKMNSDSTSTLNLDDIGSKETMKVRFHDEVQIYWIPSRQIIISKVLDWYDNQCTEVTTTSLSKSVNFYEVVQVYEIPSREDLQSISNDIWYDYDTVGTIQVT